jgi:hypothetical protein
MILNSPAVRGGVGARSHRGSSFRGPDRESLSAPTSSCTAHHATHSDTKHTRCQPLGDTKHTRCQPLGACFHLATPGHDGAGSPSPRRLDPRGSRVATASPPTRQSRAPLKADHTKHLLFSSNRPLPAVEYQRAREGVPRLNSRAASPLAPKRPARHSTQMRGRW